MALESIRLPTLTGVHETGGKEHLAMIVVVLDLLALHFQFYSLIINTHYDNRNTFKLEINVYTTACGHLYFSLDVSGLFLNRSGKTHLSENAQPTGNVSPTTQNCGSPQQAKTFPRSWMSPVSWNHSLSGCSSRIRSAAWKQCRELGRVVCYASLCVCGGR